MHATPECYHGKTRWTQTADVWWNRPGSREERPGHARVMWPSMPATVRWQCDGTGVSFFFFRRMLKNDNRFPELSRSRYCGFFHAIRCSKISGVILTGNGTRCTSQEEGWETWCRSDVVQCPEPWCSGFFSVRKWLRRDPRCVVTSGQT